MTDAPSRAPAPAPPTFPRRRTPCSTPAVATSCRPTSEAHAPRRARGLARRLGPKSARAAELLDEIAALSDHITVRRPTTTTTSAVVRDRAPVGTDVLDVRFAGIPLGHEFTSLVLALLQVGGHPRPATDESIEQIRASTASYRFETYFSLSCQNCPDVVQALNLMSVLNPRIRHVAIDGALFQDEVEAAR
jgi:NADH-dependent peroxiredoxin subunit F